MKKITDGLLLLTGKLQNQQLVIELPPTDAANLLAEGNILVAEGAFDPEAMLHLRRTVMEWAQNTAVFPQGKSASLAGINFHRRDDGSFSSQLSHVFAQFGFGDFSQLPPELKNPLQNTAQAILDLQNTIAETNFSLTLSSIRCKVINHLSGGGYLVKHMHPYLPMKVAVFLSLSSQGTDFQQGSLTFDTPFGHLDLTRYFSAGNFILFRYDLPHEITQVDPQLALNWESEQGLWVLSLELVESHAGSISVRTGKTESDRSY